MIEPGFNGDLEHCLDVGTGQSACWDGETSLNMRSDSPLDAFMEHPIDQNEGILLKPLFCVKKKLVSTPPIFVGYDFNPPGKTLSKSFLDLPGLPHR